jgi:hypothetical protein
MTATDFDSLEAAWKDWFDEVIDRANLPSEVRGALRAAFFSGAVATYALVNMGHAEMVTNEIHAFASRKQ